MKNKRGWREDMECRAIYLQVRNALSRGGLSGQIVSLQQLLVLGLEQGIARAGFREDKERHGARPRLLAAK